MKVSLNWLREYVDLPSSVETLVDLLTLAGIEVEGIETRGSPSPTSSWRKFARVCRTPMPIA